MAEYESVRDTTGDELTIREALRSMAYSERKPGHWMKPIGYQCLTYHEEKNEWVNWFKAGTGEILAWETRQLKDDFSKAGNYVGQLKYYEYCTRLDMYANGDSYFELGYYEV